jgi:O-antigen/teichoic acid export membrane protein
MTATAPPLPPPPPPPPPPPSAAPSLRARIRHRMPANALARNTAWMLMGNGSRFFLQAASFVIITRVLGTAGYGAFAGVLALVSLAVPFVGLGAGNIMIKNTARDPRAFAASYRTALAVTVATGVAFCVGALAAARFVLPASVPRMLVVSVALSDLLFAGFFDVSWKAYQAFNRLRRVAQLHLLLSALKLGAALAFAALAPKPTPASWGVLYALCTLASTGLALWLAYREVYAVATDGPVPPFSPVEGFYFSTSLAAQNVYNDLDKTMLARMSTLEATGIYAASYRVVEMAYLPIRSLFFAAYADFFQHGAKGVRATLRFGRGLMPVAMGYAVVAVVGIFLAAPLLPLLSGAGYAEAVAAARWLALIPLLRVTHHFAADILSGAGHQGRRMLMQLVVAVANVGFNLWLIPMYGWKGAAWASLLSDGVLGILMWWTVWAVLRAEEAR